MFAWACEKPVIKAAVCGGTTKPNCNMRACFTKSVVLAADVFNFVIFSIFIKSRDHSPRVVAMVVVLRFMVSLDSWDPFCNIQSPLQYTIPP